MRRSNSKKFSSAIIGSGTLPIRCGEILLQAGHCISAVVSPDAEVRQWAVQNEIPEYPPDADLSMLADRPFDYLFSIVNESILDQSVLHLPAKFAINYHDGPLPRYAGTHATSWAIMNGESVHGVSWHVITDLVDGGDVLKQRLVEIGTDETAFTLNTKCYEAASGAFTELVEDLAADNVERRLQDRTKRTFYPRFKRPARGAIISWTSPAAEICNLVRALDFGLHPNPLGVAKILFGEGVVAVREAAVADRTSGSRPGTVNAMGEDFIRVSAADADLVLRGFRSLAGESLSVSALAERFGVSSGLGLPELPPAAAERIEEVLKSACRSEHFWVRKLSSLVPVALGLPGTRDETSNERVSVQIDVPEEFQASALQNGQAGDSTDLLIAAFGAFVSRVTGVETFDLGCRDTNVAADADLAGDLFAGQVPVRFEIESSGGFDRLIRSTSKELEGVRSHRTFLNDTALRYPQLKQGFSQSDPGGMLPIGIVLGTGNPQQYSDDRCELTFEISETGCRWMYDPRRFDPDSVDQLARAFQVFLRGIGLDPLGALAQIPLLNEQDRQRVIVEWNNARIDVPRHQCIHHRFEEQVKRTPDATALVAGRQHLTYAGLNRKANQIAWHLQDLGVGPDTLVAVCLERSAEMIASILGILKAGGAYVPLDPAYPRNRLRQILEDSKAPLLVTRFGLDADIKAETRPVYLDRYREEIERNPEDNPTSSVAPKDLAYVIYTSGSTGKPKGVAIEHRSAVAFLAWAASVFSPGQLRGTLASTSVCFDLSVFEMFAPLSCGGSVILAENILHLPEMPAAREVTLINTVPSAIAELVRINGIPDSVQTVNLAGEPLSASLVGAIYDIPTVKEVYDLYGPTEDTTYSTFTLRTRDRATIGRPIANTQAYVLDRFLQPVPVGVPGELFLAGDGLAREYLGQPDLTAEKFISNPFGPETNDRMYRTGDLVRFLPSGEIEYLGRIDNQVKVRGFRIELGEVESVLSTHPGVRACVVTAREDAPGEKYLVAYYVLEDETSAGTAELRECLKERLPNYMVPTAYVQIDDLPLTPNGKVDRKALPAPPAAIQGSDSNIIGGRDDLESRLISIWEEVLGIRPIGITDNFFELGGHSLKAIRMFAEIEEAFGKNIPLATLFEAGTIEQLAEILRQDGWSAPESSLVPIQPNGTKPPLFCIHAKGGNVLFYRDLAKYLGEDQPVYGLQARRLAGRQIGHETVEDMAAFYIREIRSLQPDGPYYIGGSSFGGLVAFEIAQQLQLQDERVALLALLDTGTPDYPKMLPGTKGLRSKVFRLVRRVQHHRDSLRAFDAKGKTAYVRERLKKLKLKYRRRIRDRYKGTVRNLYNAAGASSSIPTNYIQIENLIWKAGQRYTPTVYEGDVTLFRASIQPLGIHEDPTLGWEPFVRGRLEMHEVPGHHGSIIAEPYVRVLAEVLRDCLNSVQSAEAASVLERSRSTAKSPAVYREAAAAGSAL